MLFARFASLLLALALVLSACSDDKEPELAEAVVLVDEKGGTVKVKGVTLVIPVGALDKPTMISAKQLDEATAAASTKDVQATAVSGVYEFGPKGLMFKKEIEVQFETTKEAPGAKVYFTKQGSDKDFEQLQDTTVKEKLASAKVAHFSLGFVGEPYDASGDLDGGTGGRPDAGPSGRLDSGPGSDADGGFIGPDGAVVAQPRTIVVTSVDRWNAPANQTWAAFQDGLGEFTYLPPSEVGSYTFTVSSGRYGFAYVCANAGVSVGAILYSPSSNDAPRIELNGLCGTAPTAGGMTGSTLVPSDGTVDYVTRYGRGSIPVMGLIPGGYGLSELYVGHPTDVVFAYKVGGLVSEFDLIRNLMPMTFESRDIDFNGGGTAPDSGNATVSGSVTSMDVELRVAGSRVGVSVAGALNPDGFGGLTTQYAMLPPTISSADDRYAVVASYSNGNDTMELEYTALPTNNISVQMPAAFVPSDISQAGSDYFGPSMTFNRLVGVATAYSLGMAIDMHSFVLLAEDSWFNAGSQGAVTLTFPDLTGVELFDPSWVPAVDTTPVEVTASEISESMNSVGLRRAVSSRRASFTIQP